MPGPEAKGAIIGFGDVHNRSYFYRSIIEGLAYSLREGAERTEKDRGSDHRLTVAGGGSQSDGVMQITADVFGMPVSRPKIYEASGLGAAIDVAVGAGLHSDFYVAVDEMTGIRDTFEPNQEHHKLYSELYENIYKQMYDRLKPFYRQIREILTKYS